MLQTYFNCECSLYEKHKSDKMHRFMHVIDNTTKKNHQTKSPFLLSRPLPTWFFTNVHFLCNVHSNDPSKFNLNKTNALIDGSNNWHPLHLCVFHESWPMWSSSKHWYCYDMGEQKVAYVSLLSFLFFNCYQLVRASHVYIHALVDTWTTPTYLPNTDIHLILKFV